MITKEFYVLGTNIILTAYGINATEAIDLAVNRLYEIDDKLSVFKEDSEVAMINQNAGICPQTVSEDTFYVISKAVYYSRLSEGAFDITIRPVMELWGIGTDKEAIPDRDSINKALAAVDYSGVELKTKNKTIFLKETGQAIDLGAIAKGYAADEVKRIFKETGIDSAIIDLGGNIYAMGNRPDGSPWQIGIQDPNDNGGKAVGAISIRDKAVVTSGGYERFFISGDNTYHHLMDPYTGYPIDNALISVTVIADNAIDADALTTCGYVMGLKKALGLIERINGITAIFVTQNHEIYITGGMRENFVLINRQYKINEG